MKQNHKYKQHGQPDHGVHVHAESPLVQFKSSGMVHAKNILKKGNHQICEIAMQKKGIQDINDYGSHCQHGDSAEKDFYTKLAEIFLSFIFQWCIQPPIRFL